MDVLPEMRIFVCAGMFDFKEQDFCEQARKLGEMCLKHFSFLSDASN